MNSWSCLLNILLVNMIFLNNKGSLILEWGKRNERHVEEVKAFETNKHTHISLLWHHHMPDFTCPITHTGEGKCGTYQHRARYMCSFTSTEPDSRTYQHVEMLSALEDKHRTWHQHHDIPIHHMSFIWRTLDMTNAAVSLIYSRVHVNILNLFLCFNLLKV